MTLLLALQTAARDAGWNIHGVVDAERFDQCQPKESRCSRILPGSGTALVFGSAGKKAWQQRAADCGGKPHPALGALRKILRSHRQRAHVVPAGCGSKTINFGGLGEAAGLGAVSPVLGVLVHPHYGPWVGVRAAVLFPGQPFGAIEDRSLSESFQPCAACAKHCLVACPVRVDDAMTAHSQACSTHHGAGGCEASCAARSACPVGLTERCDGPAERNFHDFSMRVLISRQPAGPVSRLRRIFTR